jgi:hypothetical protein
MLDCDWSSDVCSSDLQALKRVHTQRYETCQTVCETTDGQQSCMVYVPFKKRYRGQPDCLKP